MHANGRIMTALLICVLPTAVALGQSSSLYRASRSNALLGTGSQFGSSATSRPAAGSTAPTTESNDAARTTEAGSAVNATNGALRVSTGSSPAPTAPRNLSLIQNSLTAVSPPEPTLVKVNDLVGVVIRHRFRSQTDSRMQQKNEWDVQSKLDAWFRIHDRKWQQQNFGGGKPEVDFQHQNEMKNQGRSNRQDIVETRLMAKVIDVKPNGNLIIVGAARIGYGDDKQVLMLSGEVNSRDIGPDRTITSDKIYDLDADIKNEGTVSDAIKRGWLKEVLDKVKAF